jgi:site-specific DNA recombinase
VFDTYSDPGYSGGTLERPALTRLLADIEAGRIDTLIVYKIDRLSRSIHQFYRIWEVLQDRGVDLISATQDLNTSTSQGKLMLNMLLSFGQFEREQIGERTRDKIRAARSRGKWTGGTPILGYDVRDGRLVVNEEEAARVRAIFALYEQHGSLTRVVKEVSRRSWTAKGWIKSDGASRGGRPFDKPTLYRVLVNPLYAGKVRCNGSLVNGEHEALVDEAAWSRIQTRLRRNGSAGHQGERNHHEALLTGLLRCGACGSRMTPTYAVKGGRRYRYYVCQSALRKGAHACPTGRVAAGEIERQVVERIRVIARDPALVAETVRQAKVQREELVSSLETEEKTLRRELRGRRASLKRLGANGHETIALRQRVAAIEARLDALPAEIQAAKRARIDEAEILFALEAFGPVWDSLWPAERTRVLGLLVERIDHDGRDLVALQFRIVGSRALPTP